MTSRRSAPAARGRSILVAFSWLLLVGAASPPSPPDRPEVVAGLSVQWRAALSGAFDLFAQERNRDPDCFSVHASVEGEALLVHFVAGRPLPQDAHVRGCCTSCGTSIAFLMSREGRLLRRIAVR
ncbi:hypothetical protein [Sphingosinicella terrae]|uniref:hypothetical protein n=1 Tax=Sphingosinicella terrae TaxID=2172047 RepID=UPI000E0D7D65|nr:hypothetical protein [Sphingosinicella terrae]